MLPVKDMHFISHELPCSDCFYLSVSDNTYSAVSIISQVGWSALMYAAGYCNTEVVIQLLEAGATIDLQSTEVLYTEYCI